MKKKKHHNKIVESINHLKELIEQGHTNYALLLGSGICYSRKTIKFNKKTQKFHITNHIDDTTQVLSPTELTKENFTNIGNAIILKALIAIIP